MKKEKGSLTVEACLSLTIFLMVFLTILFLMRIVFAYGIVQHALNQTAKEFSTYTYYYAISGLADVDGAIKSSTAAGNAKFDESVSNVVSVYDSIGKLGGAVGDTVHGAQTGDINAVISGVESVGTNYGELKENVGNTVDTIQWIADNPMDAIKSVGGVLLHGGSQATKDFICGEISRALMAKYIDSGYDAANKRLKNLRVVDGLSGLNFSASQFWADGSDNEIELVACYTIKPVFPIKIMDDIHLMNKVRVRGWGGKSIWG